MSADILIVDDEADIRDLVAGILDDEGHRTRTAGSSDDALAAIVLARGYPPSSGNDYLRAQLRLRARRTKHIAKADRGVGPLLPPCSRVRSRAHRRNRECRMTNAMSQSITASALYISGIKRISRTQSNARMPNRWVVSQLGRYWSNEMTLTS